MKILLAWRRGRQLMDQADKLSGQMKFTECWPLYQRLSKTKGYIRYGLMSVAQIRGLLWESKTARVDALRIFNRLLKDDVEDPELLLTLGDFYDHYHKPKMALKCYWHAQLFSRVRIADYKGLHKLATSYRREILHTLRKARQKRNSR